MKIFVLGPTDGIDGGNEKAHADAAISLVKAGYGAMYWRELPESPTRTGSANMMREAVSMILDECEGLALLPGWEHDQTALRIRGICIDIGFPPIDTVDGWIEKGGNR